MTTETDLPPSSVAAFTEALKGGRGSLDALLEVNDEREVVAHIEAYARTNVLHHTAALQAEIERLREQLRLSTVDQVNAEAEANDARAEIEALRAEVAEWKRVAAAQAELHGEAEAENERLRAEVERLRAIAGCAYQMAGVHDAPEVWLDRLGQAANGDALPDPDTISDELLPYQPDAVCEAEARAERLAEALREVMLWIENWSPPFTEDDEWPDTEAKVQAALNSTSAQENDDA